MVRICHMKWVVTRDRLEKICPAQKSVLHTPRFNHNDEARNMEEDRAATNLGPEVEEGIPEEPVAVPKQPKRRFVGRKTAEVPNGQPVNANANIEDSSAIQGVRSQFLDLGP